MAGEASPFASKRLEGSQAGLRLRLPSRDHLARAMDPARTPDRWRSWPSSKSPSPCNFANETPLDDVLKYIKQATTGPSGSGIPIYVDPLGFQEADKSLTSPISIDLEGVPCDRTLQLLLKQLGLTYFVDDGILVVTVDSDEEPRTKLGPSIKPITVLDEQFEKVERGEMTDRRDENTHRVPEDPRGGF